MELGGQDQDSTRGLGFLGPSWDLLGRAFGAVLALGSPSWTDLGRLGVVLGRLKIDVKIDQKIDALQDRLLMRLQWILGRKMETSWDQDGVENRSYLEKRRKRADIIKQMIFS